MKLLNLVFKFNLFVILYCVLTAVTFADIPYEIQFGAVFNFDEMPVTGTQSATVRVYSDNQIVYKETVDDVLFSEGVGKIVIGGEDTLLVNSIFDDPNLEISISVLQHNLRFPLSSVPYTIRSAESNSARRVDNEEIIIFFEDEERVGINTLTPEVSLDVNGILKVFDILNTSEPSNGAFYWDGNLNEFKAYINDEWHSMSWIPDSEDRSKWELTNNPTTIKTLKNVGIGIAPNTFALAVTQDVYVKDAVKIIGNINVFGSALLHSGYGFDFDGNLNVPNIQLSSTNIWEAGNLTFSGILTGDGSNLTNLNHFDDSSFGTEHFQDGLVLNEHLHDQIIHTQHLNDQIISLNLLILNQITGNLIEDYTLTSHHIVTGAIQEHHLVQNQFSSANILLNQFVKEKFKDDSVLSRHIVDGNVTGVKVITENVLSNHFSNGAIDTNKVKNSTLIGRHVPLFSIPISNYNDVFTISRGGTGQTSFDNNGVLFTNSSGEFAAIADFLRVDNGVMSVGGPSDVNTILTIQDDSSLRLSVYADDDEPGLLQLQNLTASWNIYTDTYGDLIIDSFSNQVMKFTLQGNIGIGYNDPDEVLSLGGPILIGPALGAGEPGTIQYDGGQFSVFKSSWQPITSAAISYRVNDGMDMSNLISSSVVFVDNSDLIGQNLMIRSAKASTITGVGLDVSEIIDSRINGSFSTASFYDSSLLTTHLSNSNYISSANVNLDASVAHYIDDSDVKLEQSNVSFVSNSNLSLLNSEGTFLDSVNGSIHSSKLNQINNSIIESNGSRIEYANHINIDSLDSNILFATHLNGNSDDSSIYFAENTTVSLTDGYLSHAKDSTIKGANHLILGGKGHFIDSDDYLVLRGDFHHGLGSRSIGIGDALVIAHDDAILMNTSTQPLHSEKDGQLKIQAQGGIDISFSNDKSLASVSDFDGWGHISDESIKVGKVSINPVNILAKFRELPIQYWVYRNQENIQHLGPMAQDFYRIFNYGNSDKVIHGIDSDGVLLATIKGVYLNLNQLSDSLNINTKANQVDQVKINNISIQLADISKKINGLESSYFKNKNLLKQLSQDNKTQDSMIDYIQSNVNQIKNQIIVYKLLGFRVLFFIAGILIGSGLFGLKIYWRRQND
ncbi:MAG: tail fiber domain-containing protein [Candidatus Margulisiibacteriota bacterium]|nr:tail fiber domain-containing protein [Candidatus Margulisiibacteriota bacterium]